MHKLFVLPAIAGCLLLGTAPAQAASAAGPVEDAAEALRGDSLYLAPGANRNLDESAVRQAIGEAPIKIAVLPRIDSVAEVAGLPRRLAGLLPGNTIAVISGRYFYAGSEVICKGYAGRAATDAVNANEAALDANPAADSPSDITRPLTDFVAAVKAAPACPSEGTRGDRYADEPGGREAIAGVDDTAAVLPWVLGGIGLIALAAGALVLVTRMRTRGAATAHRDEAAALVGRLAGELAELPAGGDGALAEARNTAAARHGEAEAILLGATTDAQFEAARQAAMEGIAAARSARAALDRRS
ncbi:MAG TPA: hypothetical protein VFV67_21120 [Actinophytocola sp.]|uniref:hypothetical protein n=1 Tax=Actinophytocola sp. TaxID=1872138 RepID=UPI002DBC21AA|nr:hypothetical protein [Actinophytocola sp.]HEU5473155.1 hypothetical protein [Actinophytocola sp.]